MLKSCTPLFFIFFIAYCLLPTADCFSQTQTFKSSKIRINDYGSREQTTTFSPNIITLNLMDSLITVQSENARVNEFLNYQNQFEIIKTFVKGVTTKIYFTSSEYIFTIDIKLRVIVISKKEISSQVHSVWFEEITN